MCFLINYKKDEYMHIHIANKYHLNPISNSKELTCGCVATTTAPKIFGRLLLQRFFKSRKSYNKRN